MISPGKIHLHSLHLDFSDHKDGRFGATRTQRGASTGASTVKEASQ